ncbi:phage protein NinX family protein [Pseudomonas batumici]|uniref:phage protein NinX family protein n=1 Tax=Pseudomonas batumici TaxID=226910 RepID=UPI0030CCC250
MNELTEVKTVDLIGPALDWAVAKAAGWVLARIVAIETPSKTYYEIHAPSGLELRPSSDWAQGGPLIQSWQIFIDPPHDVHRANYDEKTGKVKGCWQTYESWHATVSARVCTTPPKVPGFPGGVGRGEGETPLIAICRAIIAAKLGATVQIPKELLP